MLDQVSLVWNRLVYRGEVGYFAKRGKQATGGLATWGRFQKILINLTLNRFDVYLNLNAVSHKGKTKAARGDVVEWRHVLVDVDPTSPSALPLAALVEFLHDWGFVDGASNDSVWLDSGRGRQAWLGVEPVVLRDDDERQGVERAMSGFLHSARPSLHGCVVDTTCSDLARVARCPGSVNWKTGRMARVISGGPARGLGPLSPDFFKPYASKAPVVEVTTASLQTWNLPDLLPHLTERAAEFIAFGVRSPGRHTAAWHTADALARAAVPLSVARGLMKRGAGRCYEAQGEHLHAKPLPSTYIEHVLKRAYKEKYES